MLRKNFFFFFFFAALTHVRLDSSPIRAEETDFYYYDARECVPVLVELVLRNHGESEAVVDDMKVHDGAVLSTSSGVAMQAGKTVRLPFIVVPDHPGQSLRTLVLRGPGGVAVVARVHFFTMKSQLGLSSLKLRVPLYSSYSHNMQLRNPLKEQPIEVISLRSSSKGTSIQLPGAGPLGAMMQGTLDAQARGVVAVASFVASTLGDSFSVLVLNTSVGVSVVPVWLSVLPPGIYGTVDEVRFAPVSSSERSDSAVVKLLNSGREWVHVHSSAEASAALAPFYLDPVDIVLPPLSIREIGEATFSPSEPGVFHRSLPLMTNGTMYRASHFAVDMSGTAVFGGLGHVPTELLFRADAEPKLLRKVHLTNHYSSDIFLTRIDLVIKINATDGERVPAVKLRSYTPEVVAAPGRALPPIELEFDSSVPFSEMKLVVRTNVSNTILHLTGYDGRLALGTVDGAESPGTEHVLDFGVVSAGLGTVRTINLTNNNPRPVRVMSFVVAPGGPASTVVMTSLGVFSAMGYGTLLAKDDDIEIPAGGSTLVSVEVMPERAEDVDSVLNVQYDGGVMSLPLRYHAVAGSLDLDAVPPLVAYLGAAAAAAPLRVKSSFEMPLEVLGVTVTPADSRFYTIPRDSVIAPHEASHVADVYFNAHVGSLAPAVTFADASPAEIEAHSKLVAAWTSFNASADRAARATVTVSTVAGVTVSTLVQARVPEPFLVAHPTLDFGRVPVGSTAAAEEYVVVRNPSAMPVRVALLPLSSLAFSADVGIDATLPPFAEACLGPLRFDPIEDIAYASTVWIRSNYSGVEPIELIGRGGRGLLGVSLPESSAPALVLAATATARPSVYKLENRGDAPLELTLPAPPPGFDASLGCGSCSLAPGESTTLTVRYAPNLSDPPLCTSEIVLVSNGASSGWPLVGTAALSPNFVDARVIRAQYAAVVAFAVVFLATVARIRSAMAAAAAKLPKPAPVVAEPVSTALPPCEPELPPSAPSPRPAPTAAQGTEVRAVEVVADKLIIDKLIVEAESEPRGAEQLQNSGEDEALLKSPSDDDEDEAVLQNSPKSPPSPIELKMQQEDEPAVEDVAPKQDAKEKRIRGRGARGGRGKSRVANKPADPSPQVPAKPKPKSPPRSSKPVQIPLSSSSSRGLLFTVPGVPPKKPSQDSQPQNPQPQNPQPQQSMQQVPRVPQVPQSIPQYHQPTMYSSYATPPQQYQAPVVSMPGISTFPSKQPLFWNADRWQSELPSAPIPSFSTPTPHLHSQATSVRPEAPPSPWATTTSSNIWGLDSSQLTFLRSREKW